MRLCKCLETGVVSHVLELGETSLGFVRCTRQPTHELYVFMFNQKVIGKPHKVVVAM